jgi:magnesium transporter
MLAKSRPADQDWAADVAEAVNRRRLNEAEEQLAGLTLDRVVGVFDQTLLERGPELLAHMPQARAREILARVAADRRADIFRQATESQRSSLMALLESETASTLRMLLAFPLGSAGSIMTTEFVSVPSTASVADVLAQIRGVHPTRETVFPIYVVEPGSGHLLHTVSLRRIVVADPHDSVLTLCGGRPPISVSPSAPRSEVTRLISRYDLLAVPVVGDDGHIVGIVTFDDVIDEIVAEGTVAVQRFGGVAGVEGPYLKIGFRRMLFKRAGWLCVLFLSEMLTASAMQHFEGELEKAVVLTLFIPLIMSSGGNSGSQATSLLIRALALGQLRLRDWWRVALKELPMGITLGAILGLIGVVRITAWQVLHIYNYGVYWPLVALTVGVGLIGIVTFGSMAGSMLPFVLKRLGFDPASASAPFVATLVDVTGLVIYFSVAIVILRGTLL